MTHPTDGNRGGDSSKRMEVCSKSSAAASSRSGTTSTPKQQTPLPRTYNAKYPNTATGAYILLPQTYPTGGTYQGCSFTDTYAATSPLHIPIPPRSAIDVLPRMHEATVSRKGRGARADILTGGNAAGPEMVAYGDCVRQQPPASGFSLVIRGVVSIPLPSKRRGGPFL